MSSYVENQTFRPALANRREAVEASGVVKQYANRIVRSARGIGPKDRQWLYDVARDRVNLKTTVRLLELAAASTMADALWGPGAMRALLVRELQPTLPCFTTANADEEEANYHGNLAQLAVSERKCPSTFEALRGWMELQGVRSQVLADVTALEETRGRSIHVVSR